MRALRPLVAAVALAAASAASFAAYAQTELNVWEDIQKAKGIADAIAAFEQEYDCKVNLQEMPYIQQLEKLRLDGPAGIGPDVLLIPSDQLGAAVVQGLIAPLKATPEQLADYTESSLSAFTTDGAVYGYPKVAETLVMYYNKDLLPKGFETMDEYYSFSKEQHAKDDKSYGLIAKFDQIYYAYGAVAPYGGYIFARDEGGNFNVEDIGLSNDGAVEAVTYLKKFYAEGLFPAGINFGVTPLPKMPNGKDMSSLLGVKGYVVSSWSKDQELAEKFIQYINKTEWAKKRFEITSEIPPLKSVMEDPIIKDNEFANSVAVQSTRAVPMPSIPEMSEVWGPIDAALQLSVSGKQDVREALVGATDQIHNQIEAFRSGF